MDLGLREHVYIVTGGTRGLGLATAQALVLEGARVVLVGRDGERVASAVDILEHSATGMATGMATGLAADLADPNTPAAVIDLAHAHFGRVDGALISGGGPPPGTALSISDDQWRAAYESVFLGGLRMVRALLELDAPMSIAWVLSTAAVEVLPGLSTSNGLRPGLAMLIKDIADEVGPRGSRINGLLPGRISTDRIAALDATMDSQAADRVRQSIPLRRYGQPEEFGRVAAFVLSPAASYMTGSLVTIDGGLTRQP